MSIMSILFVGLLLGIKHATEADHLAAVATLASGKNSLAQTVRLGVAWGVGHTLMLMLFGGLVLWLGTRIPPRLEQALEMAVGVMLVALGVDVLRRLARQRIHFHVHRHNSGVRHFHAHSHAVAAVKNGYSSSHLHRHETGHTTPLRALVVGMMHGMAGSAALIALSLATVSSWRMGLLYIAVFGVGSIIGMALLSVVITLPLRWTASNFEVLHKGLTGLVGGFSCALGAFVFYQIGIVDGLLFPVS